MSRDWSRTQECDSSGPFRLVLFGELGQKRFQHCSSLRDGDIARGFAVHEPLRGFVSVLIFQELTAERRQQASIDRRVASRLLRCCSTQASAGGLCRCQLVL